MKNLKMKWRYLMAIPAALIASNASAQMLDATALETVFNTETAVIGGLMVLVMGVVIAFFGFRKAKSSMAS